MSKSPASMSRAERRELLIALLKRAGFEVTPATIQLPAQRVAGKARPAAEFPGLAVLPPPHPLKR